MIVVDLCGAPGRMLNTFFNYRIGFEFFPAYSSAISAIKSVTSIVTAPIILPIAAAVGFVLAGYELVIATINAVRAIRAPGPTDFLEANERRDKGALNLIASIYSLILAPLSPLINLIDVIGSTVTTVHENQLNNLALGL